MIKMTNLDEMTEFIAETVILHFGERLHSDLAAAEASLPALRHLGLTKIQSILLLSKVFNKRVKVLKEIIDNSDAWTDRKQIDAEFHEWALDHREQLGFADRRG